MTNIIIMLILLSGPYLLLRLIGNNARLINAAAWGAAALFVFTGLGHFVQTEQLTWMLPEWFPQRTFVVYLTGVLEFAIAVGLVLKRTRWLSGVVAITALIVFFPANIYAAFIQIPMSGNEWGPAYLLARGPAQIIIIAWIYWFIVKDSEGSSSSAMNSRLRRQNEDGKIKDSGRG